MKPFERGDTSVLGRWWWTVDRWMLAALVVLAAFGVFMALAASPAVAERLGLDPFHFVRRQIALMLPALALMVAVSLLSPRGVRRLALIVLACALVLLAATFILGVEIKGARRWISLGAMTVQPSEFAKPAFVVISAWLFAAQRGTEPFPGNTVAIVLFAGFLALLVAQPDIGMAAVVAAVWFAQFFVAGLPVVWVALLAVVGVGAVVAAYSVLPHVAARIDRFLDPAAGDGYQVGRSIEAFASGGVFGRGPGEGTVKLALPDAHADFVFAVAGEEFGLIACLAVLLVFGFVVLRGLARALAESNLFVMLAVTGLLAEFGLQAFINMGSTVNLLPTKGMTLPFISYGGSSLLAVALGMGMALALTRRRPGQEPI
ncbi:MAG TPA: putative lipid II flippase FtsW [Alphaproteobacteria bacterium]